MKRNIEYKNLTEEMKKLLDMKKIFLLLLFFLISVVFVSCIKVNASDGKSEKPREVIEAEYAAEGTMFDRIYHFEYNGHKYIQFVNGYYDGTGGSNTKCDHKVSGIVHDPDCQCKKEKYKNNDDDFGINF